MYTWKENKIRSFCKDETEAIIIANATIVKKVQSASLDAATNVELAIISE